jgi:endonuclease YncB( thermonuclease family)
MSSKTFSIAVLVLFGCASAAIAQGFQARVVDVTAGDIFQIERKNKKEIVVLYGVVAGPSPLAAKQARQFATEKVLNQTVTVRVVERRPGMTLAELTLADGTNVGQVMLRNGLVRRDSLTAAQDQGLKDLENLAKQEHLGLWHNISLDQVSAAAPGDAAARAKAASHGAGEKFYDRRMRAGYDILEGRSWTDENGVRTMVLRGNGEKIQGFEGEVENRVIQEEADRVAYEEQRRLNQEMASPY